MGVLDGVQEEERIRIEVDGRQKESPKRLTVSLVCILKSFLSFPDLPVLLSFVTHRSTRAKMTFFCRPAWVWHWCVVLCCFFVRLVACPSVCLRLSGVVGVKLVR
mmetsp:Transcript_8/g.33  ORF Transcript_8/g.33 Transcript_8/m.33 type:complete len:105 (-) Transcript_8:734-1048(-)